MADVVFCGTVVGSRLIGPLSERPSESPRDQPGARLEVHPQIVLKGAPASIPQIRAGTEYSVPRVGRFREYSETIAPAPGDTVLVVGKSGDPVFIGHCGPSGEWDARTASKVRAVFPSLP